MSSPAASASLPATTAEERSSFLPTPRQFFVLLCLYYGLHLLLRVLVSETAGIDDADQLMLGQKWSWGYGPQPPLYTWTLTIFVQVFGHSMFSLALLRELMLLGISALTYLGARAIARSHAAGVMAAVALQFHPSICWESQRELNHSILASLMVLAIVWTILRLQPARWWPYVLLGTLGALGTLSKYNAALILLALLAAAASLPALRPRVLTWHLLATFAAAAVLLLPHLLWILGHRELAFASVYKFGVHLSTPWLEAVRRGLKDWLVTGVLHVAPVLVVLALIFWRPIFVDKKLALPNEEARLLWRALLCLCALGLLSVLLFKVTRFKDRWFQPLFVTVPMFAAVVVSGSLSRARLKAVLVLGAVSAALVLLLAPGRLFLTERLHKRDVLNAPFRKLAPDLAPLIQRADFIVTDSWTAGNLTLWFPGKLAITPELLPYYAAPGPRCLVIWEVSPRNDPPKDLAAFARQYAGTETLPQPAYLEERWNWHRQGTIRLGTMAIEKAR